MAPRADGVRVAVVLQVVCDGDATSTHQPHPIVAVDLALEDAAEIAWTLSDNAAQVVHDDVPALWMECDLCSNTQTISAAKLTTLLVGMRQRWRSGEGEPVFVWTLRSFGAMR